MACYLTYFYGIIFLTKVTMNPFRRTKNNSSNTAVTTRRLSDLLPQQLSSLEGMHHRRPDLVLAAWPEVIGQQLAGMTTALSFHEGVLIVKVKSSTLHSLLIHDKPRIIKSLKIKFPQVQFRNIIFRIG